MQRRCRKLLFAILVTLAITNSLVIVVLIRGTVFMSSRPYRIPTGTTDVHDVPVRRDTLKLALNEEATEIVAKEHKETSKPALTEEAPEIVLKPNASDPVKSKPMDRNPGDPQLSETHLVKTNATEVDLHDLDSGRAAHNKSKSTEIKPDQRGSRLSAGKQDTPSKSKKDKPQTQNKSKGKKKIKWKPRPVHRSEYLWLLAKSIRSNWTFNAKAAGTIRSLLESKCNTSKMMVSTQKNVQLNKPLWYDSKQDSMMITPSVYNRLAKDIPYKEKTFKKCSLVGSSGVLLGSNCGQEIDSSDFVLRYNLATVSGYSQDVGRRADWVTCNPMSNLVKEYFSKGKKGEERFKAYVTKEYHNATIWMAAFVHHRTPAPAFKAYDLLEDTDLRVVYGHPDYIASVDNFWRQKSFTINRVNALRPSSGLFLFTTVMSFCEEVHLYGYWPYKLDPEGHHLYYHYYDKNAVMLLPEQVKMKKHDMPTEFKIYLDFHNKGIIRLHVGKCDAP